MKSLSFRSRILYTCLIISLITSACVSMNPPSPKNENPNLISITKDFEWKTVKELSCTVKVSAFSGIADNSIRVIKIFNNSHHHDGALIANGAATPASPFVVKISLATSVPTIYVQEILPDGTTNFQTINILGTSLQVDFAKVSAGAKMSTNGSHIAANVPIIDNDSDGVGSTLDVDDNDASVAFASYFPSAGTWGTYAFEDMWPVKGDYDLNDLVLGFKVLYYTNSTNQVTKFRLDYNMRAAGSKYSLGAAFQLDNVESSNIQSVTGQAINGNYPFNVSPNGTETGVSKAVIPLFNNQQDVVTYTNFLNTVSGSYIVTPDQYVSLRFNTPLQQSDISMNAFNMFIVANKRGCEVHLPSYLGTSKFDPSIANGYNLYPGDKFKNSDGMMWGIMIPEPFEYPSERNSIVSAYTYFRDWATSSGTSHADWYKPGAGNARQDQIYQVLSNGENTVTDVEGNVYPIVTIGTQIWMAENLKTTKYNDGTTIPNVADNAIWSALTTGAYCWYNNDYVSNGSIYGALYNWYATDTRKLCPVGWHVPTNTEWKNLFRFLGGVENLSNRYFTVAGGKLKEAGTAHWFSPNIANNESGFTALPAGIRINNIFAGSFNMLGLETCWWASSGSNESTYGHLIDGNSDQVYQGSGINKNYGYSVRCIKERHDLLLLATTAANDLSYTTAKSGGNITHNGGYEVTSRGVCWNTYENPTIAYNKTSDGSGSGVFVSLITGLVPGNTYFVRAYATNEKGTFYGLQISFIAPLELAPEYPGSIYPPIKIAGIWWAPVNAGYDVNHKYGLLYQWHRKYGQGYDGEIPAIIRVPGPVSLSEGNDVANNDKYYTSNDNFADWTYPVPSLWDMATAYNPCPSGWRVPTFIELRTLRDSGSSWDYLGGPDYLPGIWFGGNHSVNHAGSVFFPAAGNRYPSSNAIMYNNRDFWGSYWANDSTNSSLIFSGNANGAGRVSEPHAAGLSVRCVKD